jgi:hypothetical protein
MVGPAGARATRGGPAGEGLPIRWRDGDTGPAGMEAPRPSRDEKCRPSRLRSFTPARIAVIRPGLQCTSQGSYIPAWESIIQPKLAD